MPVAQAELTPDGQVIFAHQFFGFPPAGPFSLIGDGVDVAVDGGPSVFVPLPPEEDVSGAERLHLPRGPFFQGKRRKLKFPAGPAARPHELVLTYTQRAGAPPVPREIRSFVRHVFAYSPGVSSWRLVRAEWSQDGGPMRTSYPH
jgi:hypothetical protein